MLPALLGKWTLVEVSEVRVRAGEGRTGQRGAKGGERPGPGKS